jgi:hypothetical protein
MAEERRRSPRFTINQLIEVDYGRELFLRAKAINISRSGLLCSTDPELDTSSRVFLSLTLPDGDRINCEGLVVRAEPHGETNEVAINFTEFREDDAEKFVQFFDDWEKQGDHDRPSKKRTASD